jgi:tetratricopeptide (TPR) repeat protein
MDRIRILIICLFVAGGMAFAKSNAAIHAFNEAVKYFNAKQFNEAIPAFDEALSNDPDFVEAYYARAVCRYYLQSPERALMDLNDALRLKPDYFEARALRGAIYYEQDHWDNALEDFGAVLEKNPKDAQSLLGRAVILMKRENWAGARRDFEAFLHIRPDDPLAPRIRTLLASLKGGASKEAPAEEGPSEAKRPAEPKERGLSAQELQKIADGLFGNPLKESYGRKVLKGERAEAVGDIGGSSHENVEIVEPR